jgi:hypothetical protein
VQERLPGAASRSTSGGISSWRGKPAEHRQTSDVRTAQSRPRDNRTPWVPRHECMGWHARREERTAAQRSEVIDAAPTAGAGAGVRARARERSVPRHQQVQHGGASRSEVGGHAASYITSLHAGDTRSSAEYSPSRLLHVPHRHWRLNGHELVTDEPQLAPRRRARSPRARRAIRAQAGGRRSCDDAITLRRLGRCKSAVTL